MRAVILGGGISGLASAISLRRALPAANILVVESSPRLGGWLSSSRQDGFLFEYGARGIRPVGNGRAAMRFIETLPGLPERTLVSSPAARTRYMLHNGRVCALPSSVVEAIRSPLTSPLVIPGARMALAAAASAAGLPALSSLLAPGAAGSSPFEDLSMHSYLSRTGGAGGVHAAEVLLDAVVSGIFAGDVRALSTDAALAPLGALLRAERQAGGMPALIGGKLRAALSQRLRKLRGSSVLTAAEREAADAAAASAALEAADSPFVRECATAASVSFADGMGSLVDAMLTELSETSDRQSVAAWASMAGSSYSLELSGLRPRREHGCVVDAALLEPHDLHALVQGTLEPTPLVAAAAGGAGTQHAAGAASGRPGRTVILTNARVDSIAPGRRGSAGAPLVVQLSSRQRIDAGRIDAAAPASRSAAPTVVAAAADYVIAALPAVALAPILEASAAQAIVGVSGAALARSSSSSSSSSSRSLRDDDESRAAAGRRSDASSAASVHAAACLHGSAGALREIQFASLAVVSLGYRGSNLLPPPHIPSPSTASAAASLPAAGAAAASRSKVEGQQKGQKQQEKQQYAGFGYLVPYAERRPAATAQPLPSELTSGRGSAPSPSAQGRYASASAGVLGMTWDSTVFPGQAQLHADALRSGALPPRRDLASGRVLPGRDVDVAPAALHGETRVTVMMGGATAPDFIEPALPHPTPADLDALRAAIAASASLSASAGASSSSNGSSSDSAAPAQAAAALAQSRVDEGFLVYKALRAAAAHVGLPATPDAVCTSVAWSAIPQYTVGHAKRVDRAVHLAQQGFASLSTGQQPADERDAAAHTRFDVIGNSFRGIGVADSLAEALAAGRRAAEVLKRG